MKYNSAFIKDRYDWVRMRKADKAAIEKMTSVTGQSLTDLLGEGVRLLKEYYSPKLPPPGEGNE